MLGALRRGVPKGDVLQFAGLLCFLLATRERKDSRRLGEERGAPCKART
jgi:hypothetical protein